MNPKVDPAIIREAFESDPESARAEYHAEFRDDFADFVTREIVDAVTMFGRHELPREPGVQYAAFCDPSGGISDSMTLAVAHLRDGAVCVLDALLEVRSPFDPEQAVTECEQVLRRFGVTRVIGDKFAGEWPRARFAEHGISFEQSAKPKSDLYHDLLPLLNAHRVELLEHPRLASQLVGLERRTSRQGKDSIDHSPGGHDDLANVVAGVLVGLDLDRRPALVRRDYMLVDAAAALPLPSIAKWIVAVITVDKFGAAAVVYAARLHEGTGPPLLLLDFDTGPLSLALFPKISKRVSALAKGCKASGSCVFVPAAFINMALSVGLFCAPLPEEVKPDELFLAAGVHVAAEEIKLCEPAHEKAKTAPFHGSLDFRAGEDAESPLRAAALLAISLSLDIPQN